MPALVLLRHGQSQWNLENRFTGWWDVDLTDAGVRGYVDCKGGIDPAMGETMRRILREELRRLGATVRVREHDGT